MRIIAVANQKGGCGKTTTTVNLAAALAHRGRRVLVVDLDPQGHATLGVGCAPDSFEKTIYHALIDVAFPISRVIVPTKIERLDVAPSNVLLSGAELDLAGTTGREFMLVEQFRTVEHNYDFCVIDCPPSLGILTLNALVACSGLVVPVQVHYYAMEGLKQLFETCEIVREHFHPCAVKILGILLTFVEERLVFSRQIQQQMREFFGDLVFDTVIHRGVRLAEAPSAGESVLAYSPNSRGAAEYLRLADEIVCGKEKVRQTDSADDTGQMENTDDLAKAEKKSGGDADVIAPEEVVKVVGEECLSEPTVEQGCGEQQAETAGCAAEQAGDEQSISKQGQADEVSSEQVGTLGVVGADAESAEFPPEEVSNG